MLYCCVSVRLFACPKLETLAFGFILKSGVEFVVFKFAADLQNCIRRFQPTPRRPAIICGFLRFRNLNRSRSSSLRNATVIFWLVERQRFANRFVRLSLPQICIEVSRFWNYSASCLVAFLCGCLRARKLETCAFGFISK